MSGPVDNAVSAISEHLEQDCLIHDVTHDELSSINRILKGMTPAERTEAISKLSDREIETWTSELDNEGFLGIDEGLSADERRDLHDMLASLLDAKQLSRVYNAYEYREQKMELASAISTNSLASTKLAFVKELAPQTIDGSAGKQKDSSPYSSDLGDTDARTVAEVLGSMKSTPYSMTEACKALDDRQLNAVFEAGAQRRLHTTPGAGTGMTAVSYSYDVKPLSRMLDAAAASDDPMLKARAFEFAGRHLRSIDDASGFGANMGAPSLGAGKQARALADSMTGLYRSDVNGITSELERSYDMGKGMSAYLQHLLSEGGAEGKSAARDFIGQLSRGNDWKGDAFERFTKVTQQDGGQYYQHAENLGYFAGSLHEAIEGITSSQKDQAALINDIFGSVKGKLPSGVSDLVGFVSKKAVDGVVADLKSGQARLFEGLVELTQPIDPRTGRKYDGPAETSYEEGWSSVTRITLH